MDRFLCFLMSSLLFNPVYLTGRFPELRDALEKLQLNDAALKVGKISSILRYYEFCHFLDPKKKKRVNTSTYLCIGLDPSSAFPATAFFLG